MKIIYGPADTKERKHRIVTKRYASIDGYFGHFRLLAIPTTTTNDRRPVTSY